VRNEAMTINEAKALPVVAHPKPASSGSVSTDPTKSTNNNRGRCSREFSLVTFFLGKRSDNIALAIP